MITRNEEWRAGEELGSGCLPTEPWGRTTLGQQGQLLGQGWVNDVTNNAQKGDETNRLWHVNEVTQMQHVGQKRESSSTVSDQQNSHVFSPNLLVAKQVQTAGNARTFRVLAAHRTLPGALCISPPTAPCWSAAFPAHGADHRGPVALHYGGGGVPY